MDKIASITLLDGTQMTAINSRKEKDFKTYLASMWEWRGVDKIKSTSGTLFVRKTQSLMERLRNGENTAVNN